MGKKVYKISLSVVYNEPVEAEYISDKLCETFVAIGNNVAMINVDSIKSVKDENKYISNLLVETKENIKVKDDLKVKNKIASVKKKKK